ncbi:MAG: aminotransferase class V-fold PLP-dependent enzyme [Gemmatimonadota bacterium]|jgi:selenocysteine lyase/cysteine desulfurase|nr:aminotransferase class V-fold PLP-dependent enzyme [Gemmatimonadota bacterium]
MQAAAALAPLDSAALRAEEFPGIGRTPYLNAAAVAPLAERARRAVEAHNRRRASGHDLEDADFEPTLARCREAAARLIGASVDEIALGGNTSFGINLAAHCLPLERGSCVVVSDREFPANVYPWMALERDGIRLERVPSRADGTPDEDRILERLERGDVSVFAVSAVQFASGFRADLPRLGRACRERGIFFVVDAIQALGQLPLDVAEIRPDVLTTGGQKWLCGPFGTGFAYVRRELHRTLEPRLVGWTAMQACEDYASLLDYRFEFSEGARKFEVATPPFQDFAGLAESLSLLHRTGVERIAAHLRSLLDPLVEWASTHPGVELASAPEPERRSGIVCFRTARPEATWDALREGGVVCVLREGAIRVSPHLYNTEAEVRRVMEIVERVIR